MENRNFLKTLDRYPHLCYNKYSEREAQTMLQLLGILTGGIISLLMGIWVAKKI